HGCTARDDGRLAAALDRLGPVIDCLAGRGPDLEPFLLRIATLVEKHWARPTRDEATATARLDLLVAFANLIQSAGATIWSRETLADLWACLPHVTSRPPTGLPPSFHTVTRPCL